MDIFATGSGGRTNIRFQEDQEKIDTFSSLSFFSTKLKALNANPLGRKEFCVAYSSKSFCKSIIGRIERGILV